MLARFFLKRYNGRFRKQIEDISESTLRMLQAYWWPGNIRELENLIERLVAISDKPWITDDDLPLDFVFAKLDREPNEQASLWDEATRAFERNFIVRALEKNGWNKTGTARYLGLPLVDAEIQDRSVGDSRAAEDNPGRVATHYGTYGTSRLNTQLRATG